VLNSLCHKTDKTMIEIKEPYKNKLSKKKFIDLFAGIGGFHTAFSSFGARCIFSSEWDKHAQQVYEENFFEKPAGDITQISEKLIPRHNILCAGFPCQAFSISGKQKGFNDTRGTLFFDVVRIAKHHQPELLVLENVKNLGNHDNGKTLKVILETLDKIGYDAFYKVLNAAHFGVPQKRERIYIVGFNKNLKVKNFEFPNPPMTAVKLKDVLLSDEETEQYIIDREDVYLKEKLQVERDIFGRYPLKPIRVGTVNKGGQGERIYHEDGHAITLSAYGGGVGAKTGLYLVNDRIRKLAPRECCHLTGLPDTFRMHSSKTQAYKQFGNSVVVDVLQHIILGILKKGIIA